MLQISSKEETFYYFVWCKIGKCLHVGSEVKAGTAESPNIELEIYMHGLQSWEIVRNGHF